MEQEFELKSSDFTDTFVEPVFQFIKAHVTGLAIHNVKTNQLSFIGSGTLIRWNEHFGILTADHVSDFAHDRRLSLVGDFVDDLRLLLPIDDTPNNFGFSAKYLNIHTPFKRRSDEFGPDLSIIELPNISELGTLQAKKSFWNFTYKTQEREKRALSNNGCMAIAGHPAEDLAKEVDIKGFEDVTYSEGLIGITCRDNYQEKDGFDYITVKSKKSETNNAPKLYNGVSGGSLWHIEIVKDKEADLSKMKPGEITLAGVPFYSGKVNNEEGHNFVVGHGPKSLYTNLLSELLKP